MTNIRETQEYTDDIYDLWQSSFGDSFEEIQFFFDNCINKVCVRLDCEEKLASMLFLVDCVINSKHYKYIFAACTSDTMKRQGLMSLLLEYCKEKYDGIALIPADDNLVNYYNNRGFNQKIDINDILFNEIESIKEYLTEGCFLSKPFALLNVEK